MNFFLKNRESRHTANNLSLSDFKSSFGKVKLQVTESFIARRKNVSNK